MSNSKIIVHGMAYVPGTGSGLLRQTGIQTGDVALIRQSDSIDFSVNPSAIIIVDGSPFSHTMIGIVSRGVPTVIISTEQAEQLHLEEPIWVDAARGMISHSEDAVEAPNKPMAGEAGKALRLADDTEIYLMASVRNAEQASEAYDNGASSIGLVRTEFLGWDDALPPGKNILTERITGLSRSASGLSISLRLVDIAADKPPRWFPLKDHNIRPLGLQGVRLYTTEPVRSVVMDQLAVLAELADRYHYEVLIPYVGSKKQLQFWVDEIRRRLPDKIPVGAMLETPAAIQEIDSWSDLVDFFAIGSNDLVQCFFGADRDEPALNDMLDPYAPVLYRYLKQVMESFEIYQDRVRLCGILPRLNGLLPVLIGLGFRKFSFDPVWIPYQADDIRKLTTTNAKAIADQVCVCSSSDQVRALLGVQE